MNANRVRIIAGAWRSRIIHFPARKDLRPTPDRVRETLFNWLGQSLAGKLCLDLFAGSGALGFEAASRGARRVMMVERDAVKVKALEENRIRLEAAAVEVRRADALEFLRHDPERYDVIFLDPPFQADYWPKLLSLLPARLASGGVIYVECSQRLQLPAGWRVRKEGRAGQVVFQLLTWNEHE